MTGKGKCIPWRVVLTWASVLAATLAGSACASRPHFADGVVYATATTYRIGPLGEGWTKVAGFGGDVGFIHQDTGAVILANASCEEYEDASLSVLSKHLLIGFTDRETISRRELILDGRGALETVLTAKLDGVPVKLTLVVLKKNHCVYDMSYTAPEKMFDEGRADFAALVQGFVVLP